MEIVTKDRIKINLKTVGDSTNTQMERNTLAVLLRIRFTDMDGITFFLEQITKATGVVE